MINRQTLVYGLVTGILIIAVHVFLVIRDPTLFAGSAILVSSLIVPVIGQIALALLIRREQAVFNLKQSFLNLWLLSVVSVVVYLLYSYVDYNYIHTDLNIIVTEYVQEQLIATSRVQELNAEDLESYKIAVRQGLASRPTLWGHLTSGIMLIIMHLFASIIISLLVVKDNKQ
jgi:hypothetical protein